MSIPTVVGTDPGIVSPGLFDIGVRFDDGSVITVRFNHIFETADLVARGAAREYMSENYRGIPIEGVVIE